MILMGVVICILNAAFAALWLGSVAMLSRQESLPSLWIVVPFVPIGIANVVADCWTARTLRSALQKRATDSHNALYVFPVLRRGAFPRKE